MGGWFCGGTNSSCAAEKQNTQMSANTTISNPSTSTNSSPSSLLGVWLIEKLWQDSWENHSSAASGYSPEGYCESEADADALVDAGGICAANGWPLMCDTPLRRKVQLKRLSLNK